MTFAWPGNRRAAVSLSFDDARPSQPDVGFPILDKHGVRASFYVSFGRLETRLDAWRGAAGDGHEIGNHTLTHPCSGNFELMRSNALEDYTPARMERELTDADAKIEQLLNVRPTTFAYPCGQTFVGRGEQMQSYVPLVARRFTVGRRAFDEEPSDPSYIDLAMITALDMDAASWHDVLLLIEGTVKTGRWLVLHGHEIGDSGPRAVPAETLEKTCAYCRDSANGIWIDTVAAIGSYVKGNRSECEANR